jgi:hypothetical protein
MSVLLKFYVQKVMAKIKSSKPPKKKSCPVQKDRKGEE